MAACSRCVANCAIIHQLRENQGSSAVTWFFKVMFDDKYSEYMFLPPKFVATVSNLVNLKIDLEDSHGVRWPVTICEVDGSLAFRHGWNTFFWDHGLTQGDLVIFIYMRTHFIVKIFDKSGCEKRDFPKSKASKKRTRSDREDAVRVESFKSRSRSSVKIKSSNPSFSSRLNDPVEIFPAKEIPQARDKRRRQEKAKDCVEDCCFLSDLVTRDKQNEDQRQLFDLFDLEKSSNDLCVISNKNNPAANFDLSRTSEVDLGGDKPENEILVANQPEVRNCEPKDIATEDIEQTEARKALGCLSSKVAVKREIPCALNAGTEEHENANDKAAHNRQNPERPSHEPTARVSVKKEISLALNAGVEEHEDAYKIGAHNRQSSDHRSPKPTAQVAVKKEKSHTPNAGIEEHEGTNGIGAHNRQNSDLTSHEEPTAQVAVKKEKSLTLNAGIEEHEGAIEMGDHTRQNSDLPSQEPTAGVVLKKEKSRTLNAGVAEYEGAIEIGDHTRQNSDLPSHEPTARVVLNKENPRTLNAGVAEYEDANEVGGYATVSGKELKLVRFEPVEILPCQRSLKKSIPQEHEEVPPLEMEPDAGALAIVAISPELDDSVELVAVARDPSCLVLPSSLAAGRLKNGRKGVLLQDPQLRLWPVFYLDRPDIKVLTSGWKAFYMANEIQPGDECIFMLENMSESLYVVAIIRKPTLLLEYNPVDQEKADY